MATKERVIQLIESLPEGPETDAWLEVIESDIGPAAAEPGTISPKRKAGLAKLASYFEHPETAPWDWDVLRNAKYNAWRV